MDETESFGIYLQLADGEKADLETVARASLEFSAAVKELAFFLDPTLDLRIELVSGTESSLQLNSFFRAVKAKATDRKYLAGLAFAAAAFLSGQIGTDIYNNSALHAFIQGHPDSQP